VPHVLLLAQLGSCAVDYLGSWHYTQVTTLVKRVSRKEEILNTKPHSAFFKMLSARSRVQILKLLRDHDDLTVEDLANRLAITVPTVSRHLQLLRIHNLVTFEQDAQNRYYSVNEAAIADGISSFLKDLSIVLPKA